MKVRLERGAEWAELQLVGRSLFIADSTGDERTESFFDDAEAQRSFAARLSALEQAGFKEDSETRRQREGREQAERAAAARLSRHHQLVAAADPRAALAAFIGPALPVGALLDAVLDRVVRLSRATAGGFVVTCRNGAVIEWGVGPEGPLSALWLYEDEEAHARGNHGLYFGADAGPPEPPDEADAVTWFLQEWPQDRYWFVRSDGQVQRYEFDGGLGAPRRVTPEAVLLERLFESLA